MPRHASKSDQDSTEDLINRVCSNFSIKLEETIDKKIDELKSSMENQFSILNQSLKEVGNMAASNTKAIQSMENKFDAMDQNSKRNTLRFLGITEERDENILEVMTCFINDRLNVSCESSDIDSVFRLNKAEGSSRPRVAIVRFVSNIKRNEVFNARRLLKKSNVSVHEDLTAPRYKLLLAAKDKFGKTNAWSLGGNIFVWSNAENKKRLIASLADL